MNSSGFIYVQVFRVANGMVLYRTMDRNFFLNFTSKVFDDVKFNIVCE